MYSPLCTCTDLVMIIMDRNLDLIPMLLHGWTVPPLISYR